MAGGAGVRFWPCSRRAKPKQFLDVLGGGKSSLRHTFERFVPMIPLENFLVVTVEAYRDLVLEHIPELSAEQVLVEPVGRNTAPSICYAAHYLLKKHPQAEMIVTPADHYVSCESEFREAVLECADFASQNGGVVSLGIRATHPETGYGYIQTSDFRSISKVKCFTEKPSLEVAQMFLQHKEFYWNSGIFACRASEIVETIEQHLPECGRLFRSISDDIATAAQQVSINRIYAECKPISIDYGVMERADNMYIKCGEFGWSDVGTWNSIHQLTPRDDNDNVLKGDVFTFNTQSSIVSLPSDKIAVVSGLNEYIVIDTPDALLICPRSEGQEIRKFVDEVKYNKKDKHL